MKNKPYCVLAILEAKEGHEEDLKAALKGVVEPSRREATCLEYKLHQDIDNPCQFYFYENWINKEAHQQQFTKPYIVELGDVIGDMLAKPYQVILANEV